MKGYTITSVCKEDIIMAFKGTDKYENVKEAVNNMTDEDMRFLASQMANDYLSQLFWDSLRILFEDIFLS